MSSSAPTSGPRFAVLKPEQLNAAQKKTLDSILSGPRAAGDPGAADMFDDRVYKRGALAVHGVRGVVGDDAFFVTTGGRLAPSKGFEFFLEAARRIAQGQVVGWFQGRMEAGPRALVPRRQLPVLRLTRSGRALSAEEAQVLSGACGTGKPTHKLGKR